MKKFFLVQIILTAIGIGIGFATGSTLLFLLFVISGLFYSQYKISQEYDIDELPNNEPKNYDKAKDDRKFEEYQFWKFINKR